MSHQATKFVIGLTDLTPSQKAVAHTLAYHADKVGENSYPSMELIARESGYASRRGAQKVVRELEAKGVVIATTDKTGGRGRDKATVYRLNMEYRSTRNRERQFAVSSAETMNASSQFAVEEARTGGPESANRWTQKGEQMDAKPRTPVRTNSHEESKKSHEESEKNRQEKPVNAAQHGLFGEFKDKDRLDVDEYKDHREADNQPDHRSITSETSTSDFFTFDRNDPNDPNANNDHDSPDANNTFIPLHPKTVSVYSRDLDELKATVARISSGKFRTDYLDSYKYPDKLLAVCREKEEWVSHNAYRRPADVMAAVMEDMRDRYDLDVPSGWVPVMREIRSEAKAGQKAPRHKKQPEYAFCGTAGELLRQPDIYHPGPDEPPF